MQQDNNHMEDKLRQLENQQLPDLSRMDAHWQQMEQMLGIKVNTPKNNLTRLLRQNIKLVLFAASVICIIICLWFLKAGTASINTVPIIANKANSIEKPVEKKVIKITTLYDTIIKSVTAKKNTASFFATLNEPLVQNHIAADTGNSSHTIKTINAGFLTNYKEDNNYNRLVDNFYEQLQKLSQEFTITAEKENTISCNEGTKIFIPAAAFVDANGQAVPGSVKITVSEYYKYSDMIAANLTTMSEGRQLITGGMIRIDAEQHGKKITLRSDKGIVIHMPTKSYDDGMQLFTSSTGSEKTAAGYQADTAATESATAIRYRNINWKISGMQSSFPVFDNKTNFLDMSDEPYQVITGRKITGKFAIASNSVFTIAEAKKILTEKYGTYYDRIKVKKARHKKNEEGSYDYYNNNSIVGDSVRLTVETALRFRKIERKDSAFYAQKVKRDSISYVRKTFVLRFWNDTVKLKRNIFGREIWEFVRKKIDINNPDSVSKYYNEYLKTLETYTFTIKNMGWINCDRFNNYTNKIDFVLNLPEGVNAEKFVSQVVFTSIRSVMPGSLSENKIGFLNVPAGMPVYVVGLGERDGKVVSFIEKLKTGETEVAISNFEETTPEAFRQKLSNLDMQ